MPLPGGRVGVCFFAWGLQGRSTSLLGLCLCLGFLARQSSAQPVLLFPTGGFRGFSLRGQELAGAQHRTGLSWRWWLRIHKILILQAQPVTPSPAGPHGALVGCRSFGA